MIRNLTSLVLLGIATLLMWYMLNTIGAGFPKYKCYYVPVSYIGAQCGWSKLRYSRSEKVTIVVTGFTLLLTLTGSVLTFDKEAW